VIAQLIRLSFFGVLGFAAILCVNIANAQVNVGDSNAVMKKNQSPLPPMASPEVVNRWVTLAFKLSYKDLAGTEGRFECRHVIVDEARGDFQFTGRGDTFDLAHGRAGAVCIKRRCENLNEMIKQAQERNKNISDIDYAELLESQGLSQDEIQTALLARKAPADPSTPPITCLNATQDHRDLIYITCTITPIECRERKNLKSPR
jgi:hypothetical protein